MALAVIENHQFGKPYRMFHLPAALSIMPPYGMNYAVTKDGQHFCIRTMDRNVDEPSVSLLSAASVAKW